MYYSQNWALLDTLRIQQSNRNTVHIILYTTLLVGHTPYPGYMRMSSWPFVSKQLRNSNRQDSVLTVFIRPPGISEGDFQLRMGDIWFCKLLLLFKIRSTPGKEEKVIFSYDAYCVHISYSFDFFSFSKAFHFHLSMGQWLQVHHRSRAPRTGTRFVLHFGILRVGPSSSCWEKPCCGLCLNLHVQYAQYVLYDTIQTIAMCMNMLKILCIIVCIYICQLYAKDA